MRTITARWLYPILAFALATTAFSALHAQTRGLTVSLQDKPLSQLIRSVERQSDYKFFYEGHSIDINRLVTVFVREATIKQTMDAALTGTGIAYELSGKRIMLIPAPADLPQKSEFRKVTGKVVDEAGQPVISAGVFVKGSSNGTVTDLNGEYSLDVAPGAVLEISCVGFETRDISAASQEVGRIVLQEDTKTLNESVVVGYGTVRKRDLTGAVASVRGDDLETEGLTSVGQAMQGKAAGLYVSQTSAQPGGGMEILVRGAGSVNASNEPLYIVDGFPIAKLEQPTAYLDYNDPGSQGVLNFLNPNDVQSIEVLKDASATAIYGSRAANGVVIITTKRGSRGNARVDYSYNYSFQQYTDDYQVLSLQEWKQAKNETYRMDWMRNNDIAPFGTNTWEEANKNPFKGVAYQEPYTATEISASGKGTDWLDLVTRNGQIHEHNLSVRGGSENTRYMLSVNYYNHKGIVKNNGLDRYTIKSNVDQKFLNIFTLGSSITLTRLDNDNVGFGNNAGAGTEGILKNAVSFSPALQPFDEATGTYPLMTTAANWSNPYSLLENTDKGRTDRLLGNISLEMRPLEGLTFKFSTGIDHANISRKTYQHSLTLMGGRKNGIAKIYNTENNQYLLEFTANYQKTFGGIHALNLLAGASAEQFEYAASSLSNVDFITDAFLYNNIGSGAGIPEVMSTSTRNKMRSYFLRAGYILNDRYLLTATVRADGASVFARNNKWGCFPSIALGWIISEEPFLRNVSALSNLKLRLSYGQTGNADIVTNAYGAYGIFNSWVTASDVTVKGIIMKRLENPDLKWETTTEWNLGLDFGFFNERLSGTAELYQRTISDLLNTRTLNTYQPVPTVISNIGKTRSHGVELTLNSRNIVGRDFSWNTAATFAAYRDNWLERIDGWTPAIYESEQDPIRPVYRLVGDHIMQTGEAAPAAQPDLIPGEIVIKDLDGYAKDADGKNITDAKGHFVKTGKPDGRIDDADVQLLGTTDPGWVASLTNTFKYKNFDFSFMFNGMFGRDLANPTLTSYGPSFAAAFSTSEFNAVSAFKERWTPENPSTKYPSGFSAKKSTNYTSVANDWFLEKAWFIRLQNITLGYRLPARLLDKSKVISAVRFNVSAGNLFLLTPYSGLDPETDYQPGAYPNARTFTAGVNISF